MKEIKEYMAAADRELKSNRHQLEAADILTKSVQALEDKLKTMPNQSSDDKIKVLHERLTALEMTQKPTEPRKGESLAIQVGVNKGRTVVVQKGTQDAIKKEDPKQSLPIQVEEKDDKKSHDKRRAIFWTLDTRNEGNEAESEGSYVIIK
ncbi:unnamed protein product [Haemonchus placei]|uniref:SGF29 C-terminal domain-containing protein n=1 Tax=Haemonchus placei TaxID=6290 RepID=A0A0N4WBD4_HAEPC|nr:unnamed protein product [Haemonchus placei]